MPEKLKKLPNEECISKMISHLADKYKDWDHNKLVAVAHSECGASTKDGYLISEEDAKNLIEEVREDRIERGTHARCIDRLQYLGFSEQEAKVMCAALYMQDTKLFKEKHEPTKKELEHFKYRYDPRTRHHGGHPTHIEIGVVPRPMALPLQAPHRPPKSEHLMRTKMERIQTEEEKWLTLEQLAKRAQYQREVQKTGVGVKGTQKHRTMALYRADALIELIDNIQHLFPEMEDIDALEFAYDNKLLEDNDFIYEHQDFLDSMNEKLENGIDQDTAYIKTLQEYFKDSPSFIYGVENIMVDSSKSSLKNAKKIPVILAREIVQKYRNDTGFEKHFKPYDELKKSIEYIDELPIIIEHKKFNENDVVGYVKELRADSKDRSIKGFAYLHESRLPSVVQSAIDAGETVPVSIGFRATMGDSGEFNGEPYDKKQENIILNHLAIVLNSMPRCPPNKCGLNLDSYYDSLDKENDGKGEERLVLIKKAAQYYNIGDSEENEKIIKKEKDSNEEMEMIDSQEFNDLMEKIFLSDEMSKEEKEKAKEKIEKKREDKQDTTPSWIYDLFLKKLDQILPLPVKKEDSEKMADNDEIEELQSKIAELEDSLSEKEETIKEYEEKERKELIDSILDISNRYKEEELKDMCLAELKIREDSVSEFKPSYKKPNKFMADATSDKKLTRENPRDLFLETNKEFYGKE